MSRIKNIVILILLAALAIASFIACHEHNKRISAAAKKQLITAPETAALVKPERTYKDERGRTHIVIKNVTPVGQTVQNLMPFVDSVAKALDVKVKQVQSVIVVPSETQAKEIAFLRKKVDSLSRLTYYYQDKYLQLAFRAGNPADSSDKGSFDFKYNADLTISQYWKRKKVLGLPLGAKKSYTDISSNDPRTTIMGVKTYTVEQKQPGWGLRIQATQNYSFISNTFNSGVGARFDLKHLSLYGAYYYNWTLHEWRPVMSMSYDIVRF